MAEITVGRSYSLDEAAYLLDVTPEEAHQCIIDRGRSTGPSTGELSAALVEEVWKTLKPYTIVGVPTRGRVKVEDEANLRQLWKLHGAFCTPTAVQFRFSTEEEALAAVPHMPYYPGYTWTYVRAERDRSICDTYNASVK